MKKYLLNLSRPQRIIIVFAILSLGFYFYFSKGSLLTQKDAVTVNEQKTNEGETVIQLQDKDNEEIAKAFPLEMTEKEVMDKIHKMSHQKIVSDKKWGAIPLTQERVDRLLKVVNNNHYVNAEVYQSILKRWAKKDFSRVDKDHNEIWDLQGGTIGIAVGISTPDEEKKFIEENFDVGNE
ncbi:DUF6241 domain-containing protein [Neobacillus pocheonensis]|uniref:DUF6241 domain-containing protein n=1 Tax=Neobacillus pocheonensis TaxID=363869 RepID=UPI003D2B40B1